MLLRQYLPTGIVNRNIGIENQTGLLRLSQHLLMPSEDPSLKNTTANSSL